ncbi:hypothetical protein GCM10011369_25370 [Neiella marina]|uniref:Uncharacterized protein n=1 Tax=Neiella marina TaxID=508461 RepID=A0A8J2U6H1_9GAMM|nr:hypothetical protein [Neiella marina]GGA82318.1 hypothetical protein GCM10011369_25370 [Neiella marina]
MSKFKHHKYFAKEKSIQSYLLPNVCFKCQKSFKKPSSEDARVCPDCGGELIELSRKFSAPKSTDTAQWKKVKYLVDNGFYFQSVYELREDGGHYKVDYPATLSEAKEFVVRFKDQAI